MLSKSFELIRNLQKIASTGRLAAAAKSFPNPFGSEREMWAQVEIQRAISREAIKWNAQSPIAWPQKDRSLVFLTYQMHLEQMRDFGQFRQTSVIGESPFSVTPLSELKPICLREMKVPQVHAGRYLPCRVVGEPYSNVCVGTIVEDVNGDVEHISFYNFSEDLDDVGWLKRGTVMLIKEPYMKIGNGKNTTIRVESPSDVIFVHPTNRELLMEAGALCWFEPERLSFEELKKAGNEAFLAKNFKYALEFYERALHQTSDSASIALVRNNMAAALLELGRFGEAKDNAELALEGGTNRAKALFCLGKAAYGMRHWREAINLFQAVLHEDPSMEATKIAMEKAKARLRESEIGEYDLKALEKSVKRGECFFDLADYVGPVKVADIPGKGKGLIVTKSVPKGTLLMVSKAYAMSPLEENKAFYLISTNLITKLTGGYSQYRCKLKIIKKLAREPETAAELYAVYAGADIDRSKPLPKNAIDSDRIDRICALNSFANNVAKQNCTSIEVLDVYDCGLWLLPSFMNHSCLENAHRQIIGDMMFVHAIRDLEEGEEVTTAYVLPFIDYGVRMETFKQRGFQCDCKLCVLERNEAINERSKEAERKTMIKKYMESISLY